jgi:hypothetical protein
MFGLCQEKIPKISLRLQSVPEKGDHLFSAGQRSEKTMKERGLRTGGNGKGNVFGCAGSFTIFLTGRIPRYSIRIDSETKDT